MIHIEIRERLRPYSHTPGATALIPGTLWVVRAFPTRLCIEDLTGVVHYELPIEISVSPKRGFTLQQDLERQLLSVFGQGEKSFFRLQMRALADGIELKRGAECWVVPLAGPRCGKARERLSLGNNKAQDWDLARRRWDLREILPLLFHLGQQTPGEEKVERSLEALCMDLFPPQISSSALLNQGARVIRDLFVREHEEEFTILPISFDSGRLVGVEWGQIGKVDFEWTKGRMRRLVLRVESGGVRTLFFPKELKEFRLRSKCMKRAEKWNNGQPLTLAAGETYFLDRFQK